MTSFVVSLCPSVLIKWRVWVGGSYSIAFLQREPSRRFSAFFKYAASRSFSNKLVPKFSQPVHSRETVNVGFVKMSSETPMDVESPHVENTHTELL